MATITKLELTQRLDTMSKAYAVMRERCAQLEADVARLTRERDTVQAAAQPARSVLPPKPLPVEFDDYYAYVNACRTHARAIGSKVVTFATRDQFNAAHAENAPAF